jgi:hypothetical protein
MYDSKMKRKTKKALTCFHNTTYRTNVFCRPLDGILFKQEDFYLDKTDIYKSNDNIHLTWLFRLTSNVVRDDSNFCSIKNWITKYFAIAPQVNQNGIVYTSKRDRIWSFFVYLRIKYGEFFYNVLSPWTVVNKTYWRRISFDPIPTKGWPKWTKYSSR